MSEIQRFIVYGMRHNPKKLGVSLDEEGYCFVDDLLKSMDITYIELEEIIKSSGGRLCLSDDGNRIRAAHGHSVKVNMNMADVPPDVLYHGTSRDSMPCIQSDGIRHMNRAYVHLSETLPTAVRIGSRHSCEVAVIAIDAKRMKEDGIGFHKSEDGVWLTEHVAPKYIKSWRTLYV